MFSITRREKGQVDVEDSQGCLLISYYEIDTQLYFINIEK
jgi:hypothetical protein